MIRMLKLTALATTVAFGANVSAQEALNELSAADAAVQIRDALAGA
jgi:hypothetical protein